MLGVVYIEDRIRYFLMKKISLNHINLTELKAILIDKLFLYNNDS